jgi:hypothetical protein
MLKRSSMLATLALLTAIASQAVGQVRSGTKIGTLNCELAPSIGFIVGSHQPMRCRYTPDGPFPPEFYEGVINTIGLDIGFTSGGVMTWSVVAPTVGPPRGALAGLYVGASGDVTAGGGVGARPPRSGTKDGSGSRTAGKYRAPACGTNYHSPAYPRGPCAGYDFVAMYYGSSCFVNNNRAG